MVVLRGSRHVSIRGLRLCGPFGARLTSSALELALLVLGLIGRYSPFGLYHVGKYPPAKPGALRCEPLKAAYPGGFGAVSHLLRGMRHQVPKLTILKHAHLDAPLFAAA